MLDRGEPQSVVCRLLHTNIRPKSFDVALAIEYSEYGVPFFRQTRIFRWIGTPAPNWNLKLLEQPSETVRDRALAAIERIKHLRLH